MAAVAIGAVIPAGTGNHPEYFGTGAMGERPGSRDDLLHREPRLYG